MIWFLGLAPWLGVMRLLLPEIDNAPDFGLEDLFCTLD